MKCTKTAAAREEWLFCFVKPIVFVTFLLPAVIGFQGTLQEGHPIFFASTSPETNLTKQVTPLSPFGYSKMKTGFFCLIRTKMWKPNRTLTEVFRVRRGHITIELAHIMHRMPRNMDHGSCIMFHESSANFIEIGVYDSLTSLGFPSR